MGAEKITPTSTVATRRARTPNPTATEAGVAWYERTELFGPWRIAGCPEHGVSLERHRFAAVGRTVEGPGGLPRVAERCGICAEPPLLAEVERCTCEHDTARCPVHQNVGCGG